MCNKRSTTKVDLFGKAKPRVDNCLKNILLTLNALDLATVASCCGHGRYGMSIVVKNGDDECIELFTHITLPRKTKFYRKDSEGYYYIPEAIGKS